MIKRRAVFLDRDGTLNEMGDGHSPLLDNQFHIFPGVIDAIEKIHEYGYLVFVVTNQPDVARGFLDINELYKMNERLQQVAKIDEIMVCPHDDLDNCVCRKPKPGMLIALAEKWNIDMKSSFMIGDSWRDVEAGRAAGCKTIYLGASYDPHLKPDFVASSLMDAVIHGSFSSEFLTSTTKVISKINVAKLEQLAIAIATIRERGGRLFFLGVGGGAGHASHAVNDFRKLACIECYAPTDNVSELTARINDEGWDDSFAEWLRGSRLNSKDGIFVFSVGGGDEVKKVSVNIVNAVKLANKVGATVLGIVGRDGGYTAEHGDIVSIVPTVDNALVTPLTEAFQAVFWHLLVSHPLVALKQTKWEHITGDTI